MRVIWLFVSVFLLTFLTAPLAAAQPPPTINLRLPSDAAGGGTLAVRLTIPPQVVGPRYGVAAPILVFAPGGQGVGGLAGGQSFALQGFVAVTFIFPGGTDGGFHSDGVYDYRGDRSIAALRDVLLFAGGRKTDDLGRAIGQLLPFGVLTEMVGLIGSSNGGPISMAALATYGTQLGFVATYVGWENPTNGQTVVIEVGGKSYDCDPALDGDGNGVPSDDGKNPYLTAYSSTTIGMDWDRLAYDPSYGWTVTDPANQHPPVYHTGAVFLDGNSNGTLDAVPGNPECFDIDGDGRLDVGEDYFFRPTASYDTGSLLLHHSLEVASEAAARGIFPGPWPADIATLAASDLFWSRRDATRFYGPLAVARPDLHCLLAFSEADHVQAADEHPHIQQAYDGLRGGGIWCRLNPDETYYRLLDPAPPLAPADSDANITALWPDMPAYDEPYGLSSNTASLAGVMELADRVRAGNWLPNLDGPLTSVGESPALAARGALMLDITPHPATSQSEIQWRRTETGPASRLVDPGGRLCGSILLNGADLEGRLCLGRLRTGYMPWVPGVYWLELRTPYQHASRPIVIQGR